MIEREGAVCDPDIYHDSHRPVVHIFGGDAAMTKVSATNGASARRYAWLSIAAAFITIRPKPGAYYPP
jgi:hypothetical protein